MSKARELAELGDTLTVDGSGNIDVSGAVTADGLTVDGDAKVSSNLAVGSGSPWTTAGSWRSIKLTDRHGIQATPASSSIAISSNTAVGASGYEYTVTGTAAGNYTMAGNSHIWNGAASGTIGGAVTFAEYMRIDGNGHVLCGVTSLAGMTTGSTVNEGFAALNGGGLLAQNQSGAIAYFSKAAGYSSNVMMSFYTANSIDGSITTTGTTIAYNTSSDYRLKDNITPVQGASDIVKAMQPVTYTYKADGSWMDGFLAHELQELHPRAVTGSKDAMMDEEYEVTPAVYEDVIIPAVDAVVDEDGNVTQEAQPERTEQRLVTEAVMGTRSVPDYQGVDYSKLTPILTAALQEALNKIDALEARLTALEAV